METPEGSALDQFKDLTTTLSEKMNDLSPELKRLILGFLSNKDIAESLTVRSLTLDRVSVNTTNETVQKNLIDDLNGVRKALGALYQPFIEYHDQHPDMEQHQELLDRMIAYLVQDNLIFHVFDQQICQLINSFEPNATEMTTMQEQLKKINAVISLMYEIIKTVSQATLWLINFWFTDLCEECRQPDMPLVELLAHIDKKNEHDLFDRLHRALSNLADRDGTHFDFTIYGLASQSGQTFFDQLPIMNTLTRSSTFDELRGQSTKIESYDALQTALNMFMESTCTKDGQSGGKTKRKVKPTKSMAKALEIPNYQTMTQAQLTRGVNKAAKMISEILKYNRR